MCPVRTTWECSKAPKQAPMQSRIWWYHREACQMLDSLSTKESGETVSYDSCASYIFFTAPTPRLQYKAPTGSRQVGETNHGRSRRRNTSVFQRCCGSVFFTPFGRIMTRFYFGMGMAEHSLPTRTTTQAYIAVLYLSLITYLFSCS